MITGLAMDAADRARLPGWLSSGAVTRIGIVLALLALALAAGFAAFERSELRDREIQAGELLARVLQDHADRTFDTVDVALATLADGLRGAATDSDELGRQLSHAQQGLPFIRSLSLADSRGRVIASTAPANVGLLLDPARVPLPDSRGAVDRLGPLVAGRDLADAVRGATAPAPGRHFMPLTRRIDGLPGHSIVAALNLDFFANAQRLLLADADRQAALFAIDGTLLAATDGIHLEPGQSRRELRFFADYLPARESGAYIGRGIDGAPVATALRLLRRRPIAVVVERDEAGVDAEFMTVAGSTLAVAGMALALIGSMTGLARRSLQGHEAAARALDDSRARVEASERDLRTLVEAVQELIFRTDAAGNIVFVNGRWLELSGYPRDAALGRTLSELCVRADRHVADACFDASRREGPRQAMLRLPTRRGDCVTLEVSISAIHEGRGDGELTGYAGFAIDVTARESAREQLEAQLRFSAQLLEVSPTPLFVKDEAGRFTMVNAAWLDLMALTPQQVIGRTSEGVFGDAAGLHLRHDASLGGALERTRYENRLVRPDGEERDTVVTKVRLDHADGRPAGMVGSIFDVTEFREAERVTREARDAAERANRAKSDFIANITHELRTPLQAIIGFSEMGSALAETQPDYVELFGDIQAGGRRMLVLVNGLLDIAKLERGAGDLALVSQPLEPLAAAVAKELRFIAAERGLEVRLAAPNEPVIAAVDAVRFQQVLRNVLANALRFSPDGSTIDVRIAAGNADGVEICVSDHGPGIPPDELEAVFEPFTQSSRTRDGSGGTGLGLTICRKLMSAHGGSIVAERAEGGGTSMRLRLPIQDAMREPAAAAV